NAHLALAELQYRAAANMTDRLSALRVLAFYAQDAQRDAALQSFYDDWHHETLVVNQWLQVQATIPDDKALQRVESLMTHVDFDLRNPNKVRSLIGAFCGQNPVNFHRVDGAGYRLLTDLVIKLDAMNPQIAARLLVPLTKWRNYRGRDALMRAELERLAGQGDLSPDVFEVVTKSLD
ncbi:MAG: aminopeptidase N C-terminal domain-containing protein, partial [Halioglobus sp.]